MSAKRFSPLLVGCAVIVAASLVMVAPAFAKGKHVKPPKASVTPHTLSLVELQTNNVLAVSGSRFVPNSHVFITQCSSAFKGHTLPNASDCSFDGQSGPIVITSTGTIPTGTTFRVFRGPMGTSPSSACGTSKQTKRCYVNVADAAGDKTDSANVKVTLNTE